jgi:MoaA/NifB/PqqE/SkfB family radical SAM enzyme
MTMRYKTVALLYTRTCPLACRHCIIESSPRETEKMTQSVASGYIDVLAKYSDQVCFTGGEPMLYYKEILPLIRQARSLGMPVAMVTGAGWVSLSKPHIARERVAQLIEAGLNRITISWDPYHEEFSPQENALLLISLFKETNIELEVRGVVSALGSHSKIEEKLVSINAIGNHKTQDVVRLGSASTLPTDHFHFMDAIPKSSGCGTVYTPSIEPDGNVYACCGPSRYSKSAESPLVLGNTNNENLDSIFNRSVNDPFLEAIGTIGPRGLFDLIKNDPSMQDILPRRDRYTGICEACLDMSDIPAVVQRLRERLSDSQLGSYLVAARMERQSRLRTGQVIESPM